MNVKVTENKYNEVLDNKIFSSSDSVNVIQCTEPNCSQPPVWVEFNEPQFSCTGK